MRTQQLKAKDAKIPYEEQLKSVNSKIAEAEAQVSKLRVSIGWIW
jgi:hypothetical protein